MFKNFIKNKIRIRKNKANLLLSDINLNNIKKLHKNIRILSDYHAVEEDDYIPRFGNLLARLKSEVQEEISDMERKRLPSQNDLTRWALKSAVLDFYQQQKYPEEYKIVEQIGDDRLISELAPDFDVIAGIWLDKLDQLLHRSDKYQLNLDEFDKAEEDLADGMRGSAFEKQLDRYRIEFMNKL